MKKLALMALAIMFTTATVYANEPAPTEVTCTHKDGKETKEKTAEDCTKAGGTVKDDHHH